MRKKIFFVLLLSAVLMNAGCNSDNNGSKENTEGTVQTDSISKETDESAAITGNAESSAVTTKTVSARETGVNSDNAQNKIVTENGEILIVNGELPVDSQNPDSNSAPVPDPAEEKGISEFEDNQNDDGVIELPFIPFN